MNAPSAAVLRPENKLDRVVIRAADGRTWDLGRPVLFGRPSPLFALRLRKYKWTRRAEFAEAAK